MSTDGNAWMAARLEVTPAAQQLFERRARCVVALAAFECCDGLPDCIAIVREPDRRQRIERLQDDDHVVGAKLLIGKCGQRGAHAIRVLGIHVELVEQDGDSARFRLAGLNRLQWLRDALIEEREVLQREAGQRLALVIDHCRRDAHGMRGCVLAAERGRRDKESDEQRTFHGRPAL